MRLTLSSLLLLAACGAAQASVIVNLDPPSGNITGWAGDSVGWGFTLTSDSTAWISVLTSFLIDETNPALGAYTDFIGSQGGPVNAVLAPGAPPWTETFDSNSQLGVGSFSIDPSAAIGATDSGILNVEYETFSGDPNVCGSCDTGFADTTAAFSIQVTPTPEPRALGWLTGFILLVGQASGLSRRRRRQPTPLDR